MTVKSCKSYEFDDYELESWVKNFFDLSKLGKNILGVGRETDFDAGHFGRVAESAGGLALLGAHLQLGGHYGADAGRRA